MTDLSDTTDNTDRNISVSTSVFSQAFYRRKQFKITFIALFLATILAAVFFAKTTVFASLDQEREILSHALSVQTMVIKAEKNYQVRQKYAGNIVAGRESDHGFDTAGLLAEVLVNDGDRVKKGDILARLDMRRLEARKQELDASLAQAIALNQETKALLDRAQATYDRYSVLVDRNHISIQKYDDIKFDLIALKARKLANEAAVTLSRAALRSLEINRDLATLTAQFNGSVIRRYQDEGTALAAGTPVIRLIENQKLEIQVGFPQSAVAALKLENIYIFDYQGQQIETSLRAIINRVDQSTRTVTAIFDVTSDTKNIRPGGLAQLAVKTTIQQAGFWLPSGALAESRRGLWSVYTLIPYKGSSEYSLLSRQELQLLYTDSDRVFVRGTLQDGHRVVTAGIHRLVPGQLVRLSESE
ncbi:MAG: efflux RND transporter periplasmic adaptor subunit [Emcibacter sp.]|nr:efflux RND transporter periplasmic adaptor subunit [Emcibacter sp.]